MKGRLKNWTKCALTHLCLRSGPTRRRDKSVIITCCHHPRKQIKDDHFGSMVWPLYGIQSSSGRVSPVLKGFSLSGILGDSRGKNKDSDISECLQPWWAKLSTPSVSNMLTCRYNLVTQTQNESSDAWLLSCSQSSCGLWCPSSDARRVLGGQEIEEIAKSLREVCGKQPW